MEPKKTVPKELFAFQTFINNDPDDKLNDLYDRLDEDEDDYMMNPPQPEDFENITGEEKELSDEDFPTYVDDLI
jgi:hypothetical protein